MPKIKTSCVEYTEGWVLIESIIRELDAKIRQEKVRSTLANFPHFSSKKPLHITYNNLFYRRRKDASKELYDLFYQGYADLNLIAKWNKVSCLSFISFELGTKTDDVDLALSCQRELLPFKKMKACF